MDKNGKNAILTSGASASAPVLEPFEGQKASPYGHAKSDTAI
jgi:hypothetical protein